MIESAQWADSMKIGQSGGAGRWRVCYQRGLTRQVIQAAKLFEKPEPRIL